MDVVKQIEVAPFECPAVILPTPANMKQLCMELAAMPAKILAMLEVEAATAAGMSDEVKAEIDALDKEELGEEAYKKKVEELAGSIFLNLAQSEIDGLMSELEKLREVVDIILEVLDAPVCAFPVPRCP